jgi:hypothetical protein
MRAMTAGSSMQAFLSPPGSLSLLVAGLLALRPAVQQRAFQ